MKFQLWFLAHVSLIWSDVHVYHWTYWKISHILHILRAPLCFAPDRETHEVNPGLEKKHKNGQSPVNFTDIDLQSGVLVAECCL